VQLSILKELQRSLDPFQLTKVIDRKLERIYRLTNRRLSPKAQEKIETSQGKQVHRGRRKGCEKDARFARLEIPTGFPQPQQQQTFSGYISNGATWITRVTFSNGFTRAPHQFKALIFRFAKMACPDALTRFSP
jgi:hypothetical protein